MNLTNVGTLDPSVNYSCLPQSKSNNKDIDNE